VPGWSSPGMGWCRTFGVDTTSWPSRSPPTGDWRRIRRTDLGDLIPSGRGDFSLPGPAQRNSAAQGHGASLAVGGGDWRTGPTGCFTAGELDELRISRRHAVGRGPRQACWSGGWWLAVAAPWRLLGDPVRSSRDAGDPAAAGHQGLLGACCCACVAVDGESDRALRRHPGGLSGHRPIAARAPAGRLTGFGSGAAAGGRAAGSAGTCGAAAGHTGCRACWGVLVASYSPAARPCSGRVACLVHPARSSGAAPPPAGLTAVRAWYMTGAG
jgi:hypothetical protein